LIPVGLFRCGRVTDHAGIGRIGRVQVCIPKIDILREGLVNVGRVIFFTRVTVACRSEG
jgi:hypothetical protein